MSFASRRLSARTRYCPYCRSGVGPDITILHVWCWRFIHTRCLSIVTVHSDRGFSATREVTAWIATSKYC